MRKNQYEIHEISHHYIKNVTNAKYHTNANRFLISILQSAPFKQPNRHIQSSKTK